MFNKISRKLSRAALAMALTLPGAVSALLAGSAEPAMALCKYGGPHCVHGNQGGSAKLPNGDPTTDADCEQYSSCGFGSNGNWGDPAAFRRPIGVQRGRIGTVMSAHATLLRIK